MPIWSSDESLFNIIKKELYTALVGDILDDLGFLHQFLSPDLKPLSPDMIVAGRAMPVQEMDINAMDEVDSTSLSQPFGIMFEALDDLKPNEVYVCSGSTGYYALWGGLMSTRARHLNAAGAVVNGYSRDTNEILRLNFPVISKGTYAQDQKPRGKVVDFRTIIDFDGIEIHPGDIIYGDRDGVIVVPKEVEEEVFSGAIEKARGEKLVKKTLENGVSSRDAFNKYGIM